MHKNENHKSYSNFFNLVNISIMGVGELLIGGSLNSLEYPTVYLL